MFLQIFNEIINSFYIVFEANDKETEGIAESVKNAETYQNNELGEIQICEIILIIRDEAVMLHCQWYNAEEGSVNQTLHVHSSNFQPIAAAIFLALTFSPAAMIDRHYLLLSDCRGDGIYREEKLHPQRPEGCQRSGVGEPALQNR